MQDFNAAMKQAAYNRAGVARVSSIVAGGYNIQCLHVRVIVR